MKPKIFMITTVLSITFLNSSGFTAGPEVDAAIAERIHGLHPMVASAGLLDARKIASKALQALAKELTKPAPIGGFAPLPPPTSPAYAALIQDTEIGAILEALGTPSANVETMIQKLIAVYKASIRTRLIAICPNVSSEGTGVLLKVDSPTPGQNVNIASSSIPSFTRKTARQNKRITLAGGTVNDVVAALEAILDSLNSVDNLIDYWGTQFSIASGWAKVDADVRNNIKLPNPKKTQEIYNAAKKFREIVESAINKWVVSIIPTGDSGGANDGYLDMIASTVGTPGKRTKKHLQTLLNNALTLE